LEEVDCPICGRGTGRRTLHRNREGVGFHRCASCGLMFASPRFTENALHEIYETEAFEPNLTDYRNWSFEQWRKGNPREYVISELKTDLLERSLANGARVLDVGCSVGLAVHAAIRRGFRAEGLEPSRMLSAVARDNIRVPVTCATLEDFRPEYGFDGLLSWDVLDHVYDPVGFLRRCKDVLNPGGVLFAQTPNYRGFSNTLKTFLCRAGLRGPEFKHFGFPWHIHLFDKQSLGAAVEKAGLALEAFEAWTGDLKDGRRGFFARKLADLNRERCWSDYIICTAKRKA
jgi:SAM-dependent methyltransferase